VKKIEKALEGNEKGAAKCEEKTTVPLGLWVIIYERLNFTSFYTQYHLFLFDYCTLISQIIRLMILSLTNKVIFHKLPYATHGKDTMCHKTLAYQFASLFLM
jgi:hypothetical protein